MKQIGEPLDLSAEDRLISHAIATICSQKGVAFVLQAVISTICTYAITENCNCIACTLNHKLADDIMNAWNNFSARMISPEVKALMQAEDCANAQPQEKGKPN